jgi:hypothetical protein
MTYVRSTEYAPKKNELKADTIRSIKSFVARRPSSTTSSLTLLWFIHLCAAYEANDRITIHDVSKSTIDMVHGVAGLFD